MEAALKAEMDYTESRPANRWRRWKGRLGCGVFNRISPWLGRCTFHIRHRARRREEQQGRRRERFWKKKKRLINSSKHLVATLRNSSFVLFSTTSGQISHLDSTSYRRVTWPDRGFPLDGVHTQHMETARPFPGLYGAVMTRHKSTAI